MGSVYPRVPGRSWDEIDKMALAIANKLVGDYQHLLKPQAMFRLFQDGSLRVLGLEYAIEALPQGEEGKYDPAKNEIILSEDTYAHLELDHGRAKFTLAHEIGHAVLHGPYLQRALSGRTPMPQYKRSQLPAYANPECQANKFASCFLMPAPLVRPLVMCGAAPTRVTTQIVSRCGVSFQAADIRRQDFKISNVSNF